MNGGEFWILFWATIGGLYVFFGLLLEKLAEWMNDKFLGGYKPHKSLESFGWFLLMFGICIEVADAGWTAHEINKNNPINSPASEIRAVAVIDINETNASLYSTVDFSILNFTYLELLGTNIYGMSYYTLLPKTFPREFVHKDGFGQDAPVKFIGFSFEFEENPVPAFEMDNFTNYVKATAPPVKDLLNDTKAMRFYFNFIPKTTQIIGGHVTLQVNGFPKYFTIYAQGTDTNLSTWNPTQTGIYLYATNSTP